MCVLALFALAGCGGAQSDVMPADLPVAAPSGSTPSPAPNRSATPAPNRSATPAPVATATPPPVTSSSAVTRIAGCEVFPPDNPWNTDVSRYPVDPNSSRYIAAMNGSSAFLHEDFGIPYVVVSSTQPKVPIRFIRASESDPGPYPVPRNAPIEPDRDSHVLVLQSGTCMLYELYAAHPSTTGGWNAADGATFNLRSDELRPDGWASADAAGLPLLPGLVRYDEVAGGAITHALRFTVHATQMGFIHPATHYASTSSDPALPPMGLRLRLKASYDISRFTGEARVILTALKKYGMFVADNGSDFALTGAPDPRWHWAEIDQLRRVPGSAFEVVRTGPILK